VIPFDPHPETRVELDRAEWERKFQQASLRRLAREARRARAASGGTGRSGMRVRLEPLYRLIRRHPAGRQPLEVPCVDC